MDTKTQPAWERFSAMSAEVHDMLIGSAQARNHLKIILEVMDDEGYEDLKQLREDIAAALDRLTRVGI
jgi:hypothetical protein